MSAELSDDLFFGGRLRLLQPKAGHRFGGDAALLASAARSRLDAGAAAVDLGAGVGAAGLALAACGAGHVTLVEIDDALAALGEENARRNGFGDRTLVLVRDVAAATLAEAGRHADLVVANPPFDDAVRHRASPDPAKARAHQEAVGDMEDWVACADRMLKSGGSLVMIHRAEALGRLFAALGSRFGEVRVRPVHPRAEAPAARVLIAARKAARGPLALLPGLVMHGADGRFTREADAAQRGDGPIDMG